MESENQERNKIPKWNVFPRDLPENYEQILADFAATVKRAKGSAKDTRRQRLINRILNK